MSTDVSQTTTTTTTPSLNVITSNHLHSPHSNNTPTTELTHHLLYPYSNTTHHSDTASYSDVDNDTALLLHQLNGSVTTTLDQLVDSTLTPPTGQTRSDLEVIILGVIVAFVIAITVFGNLLVIVTVLTTKKIQTPTNYFILSLAITDLCIGTLVMPFSAVNSIHWEWPLGAIFCNIYTSIDVMLCTVSILTLFAISLDRYWAVTRPLRYQQKITCGLVFKSCAAIWAFSFVLAFVPIHLGWNSPVFGEVQNMDSPRMCEFALNPVYVLLDAIGTYFAPLTVMICVYAKVLRITKKQVQEINKMTKLGGTVDTNRHRSNNHRKEKAKQKKHRQREAVDLEKQLERQNDQHQQLQPLHSPSQYHPPQPKPASDTKATITLASLVLAFAVCWIPYFVLFTMKPFLNHPINIHLDLFCLWLGYINSGINPFLYAYYNSTFRNAFARVLCRGVFATYIYDAKRKQRQRLASTFTDSSELAALHARMNGKPKSPSTGTETLCFTVNDGNSCQ